MTHVKHLGFEDELRVTQIVKALMWVPEDERLVVVAAITPAGVRRAVADMLHLDVQ